VIKLLPCDHEVMGSSPENSLLQTCRERLCKSQSGHTLHGSYASGSYVPYYYYYYGGGGVGGGGGGVGAVVKLLPCDHEVETASFRNAGKCYVHKTQSGWPYPSPDPAQAGAMCTGLPFIYYLLKHMEHRLCFLCGVVLYLVVNLFSILHNFILFSVNIFFA
jgi:hypothetical protein